MADEFAPVVFIDILRSKTLWPWRRPQRWYFVALSADNQKALARSSEMYTNREDAADAAWLAFSHKATAFLRQGGDTDLDHQLGNVLMRRATSEEPQ